MKYRTLLLLVDGWLKLLKKLSYCFEELADAFIDVCFNHIEKSDALFFLIFDETFVTIDKDYQVSGVELSYCLLWLFLQTC